MTAWRRLQAWQQQGVWQKLHVALLAHLREADRIDWSQAIVDSSSERAIHGKKTGPNPTDRGKPGSKHHLVTYAAGIPLAATLTGANVHDVTQLLPLVERTISWLHQRRRLRVRCERQDDIHQALLTLGCIVICGYYL